MAMTGDECKELITHYNQELESVIDPAQYVLNPLARQLINAIRQLQSECPHHFINGQCEYCGQKERHTNL